MSSAVAAALPQQAPHTKKPVLTIDATNLSKPSKSSFVIPTILITPPDEPARYSSPLPEQQYEKTVLFVPVKTEELGWEEHGLYWNGTYAYPVHQIYDREGEPIGRRRKGPQGYRFEEYYENKKPRRSSSSHHASTPDDMEVEEASVRLDEPAPAPARIERSDKVCHSIEEEQKLEEQKLAEMQVEDDDDEDLPSPSSPTLSVTDTEDSASFCDDSSSLWSRNDAKSDDEESVCTSPGIMSPPMDVDEEFQPETLSKKLSDLPAEAGTKALKTSWLQLGTLPSSSASSSRSQSLPTARVGSKKSLEFSSNHRATSTLITDSHRDSRRHSSPSAYTSIIQDLTTSPFAKSASTPFRSATLPRSSSRSGYKASKAGGSILRPPPQYVTSSAATSTGSIGRKSSPPSSYRRASDIDFSAGWNFENQSAKMSSRWQDSFADHY